MYKIKGMIKTSLSEYEWNIVYVTVEDIVADKYNRQHFWLHWLDFDVVDNTKVILKGQFFFADLSKHIKTLQDRCKKIVYCNFPKVNY